ncbi:putative enzyme related to lactoylglutathione lyase [Spinactinospora alkalitolerans]|uniref:Putative enzyme related to lactoylglutathione lyase n=1 Tax=Spinactinospora alkalitolerans TaxID=687207 RepID=A0A852TUL1_9ACTN|nr:VOC family protein [Spinactinospora alkalitolerans]NYE45804.1 putative enzyme related to lactoylglutathione lyase [Spinactinospora alkalitolerans]
MRLVVVLDTNDVSRLAAFWSAALGFERGEPDPPYLALRDPGGVHPDLLLQDVPEPGNGKNRMHLDLVVDDMNAEVARLVRLGAVQQGEPFTESGHRVAVMGDPEGNEFCVIDHRGAARPESQDTA